MRPPSFERLFADRALRTPLAVAALDTADGRLTYGELAARSGRLAMRLAAHGVGPDVLVGIAVERGLSFLTAVLGILRAGGAYLPLDLRQPPARLRALLAASGVRLCVSAGALDGLPVAVEPLLAEETGPYGGPEAVPDAAPPEALAYVMYTSGSSGLPKGAMVERRGMLNHLLAKIDNLGLGADDVVAQTAAVGFDISVWQLLAPLLAGGRTAVIGDEVVRDPRRLLAACERAGVSVLEVVPSQLQALLDLGALPRAGSPLRLLLATGEDLPVRLCRRWLAACPHIPVVNAYGPTECSDDVTHGWICDSPPKGELRAPIGRPLSELRIEVLDSDLLPAPPGEPGELCVAGIGVGRGYLFDPARTAASFVPDPAAGYAGSRLYRTGDLARRRADGQLEYLGRFDEQVKVRGFRIEPAEICAVVEEHPDVAEAAVFVREIGPGDRRLAAIATVRPGRPLSVAALRAFLTARLPPHLLPSTCTLVDALPRNANGKLDREALARQIPGGPPSAVRHGAAEDAATERALAELWCEILGLDRVGFDDGFFEVGGDSLLAARLQAAVTVRFGCELDLLDLYRHPTIRSCAALLAARTGGGLAPALVLPVGSERRGRDRARQRARQAAANWRAGASRKG